VRDACTRILRLDLSKNKVRVLPDEVGLLTSLQELDVSHNILRKLPRYVV
jgi:Leucine-rich repeat (LRR) protein